MKNSAINRTYAVLVILLATSTAWATVYQERDEINRSFTLGAKSRVEVSGISGSVDIQATDGDTAIVRIERTGRSRAELDCNNVVVDHVWGNLIVQSKPVGGRGCKNIQVVYRVLLSLPRHVDVSVRGVSGPVDIGEIAGTLRISGNSGNINLAQSGRGSSVSGNSGTTSIQLRKIDSTGLDVSGNSGAIKLYVGDQSNVEVRVTGLSGSVLSEVPNVQFTKTGSADYYARIGSGGPTINAGGNSGSIVLLRYRE